MVALEIEVNMSQLEKEESDVSQEKLRDLKRQKTLRADKMLYEGDQYCYPIQKSDLLPIIKGGLVAGLGVAAMHYIGMWSMHINADVTWDWGIVLLSVIIAMAVAIVGLCLLSFARGRFTQLIASLVIGLAVCSMHYTGMYGMEVRNVCTIGTKGCDPYGGGVVLSSRVLVVVTFCINTLSYLLTLAGRTRILRQRNGMLLLLYFISYQIQKSTAADAFADIEERNAQRDNVLVALIAGLHGIKAGDLSAFLKKDFEVRIKSLLRKYRHRSVFDNVLTNQKCLAMM